MCFSAAPQVPEMKKPTPAPTEREGTFVGLNKRRNALAEQESSGLLATNPTGAQGVTAAAPVLKSTLGGS